MRRHLPSAEQDHGLEKALDHGLIRKLPSSA